MQQYRKKTYLLVLVDLKRIIKKEKQDRCHTILDQLRNNLSEKSKRLLDVSMEKGVLNLRAALPITDFGFELSKQQL